MKKVFLDTNVFLRFFTRDNEGQHERAVKLFNKAKKGSIATITGPPVLFEIVWTLRTAYRQSREKTLSVIEAIVAMAGITLTDAQIVQRAVNLAKTSGQEFADAYMSALARMSGADEIATFNTKHFAKLGATLHRF